MISIKTIPYQIPPVTPNINKADNTVDPARVDLPIWDEDLGLDRLYELPQTTRIGRPKRRPRHLDDYVLKC